MGETGNFRIHKRWTSSVSTVEGFDDRTWMFGCSSCLISEKVTTRNNNHEGGRGTCSGATRIMAAVLAVFFNLSNVFDKVWEEGVLVKLLRTGVRHKMYIRILHFLFVKTA